MSNTDEARKVNRRMVVQSALTALEGGVPETAVNSQVTESWPRRE